MKKLALSILLLAGVSTSSWAYSMGDLYRDARDQTHLTILKNANIGYFQDLQEGTDKAHQGGVIDHVVTYRFISLSVGWRGVFNGNEKGIGLFGPSLRIDKALALAFPEYVDLIKSAVLPDSALKFFDALFLGIDEGWDFDNLRPRAALHAGIAFEW